MSSHPGSQLKKELSKEEKSSKLSVLRNEGKSLKEAARPLAGPFPFPRLSLGIVGIGIEPKASSCSVAI